MTQRLYYDDAYTLNFTASVVERTHHHQRPAVVLDASYFYPEGGAQPADHGTLNAVRVIDVQTREADRAVLHILDGPLDDLTAVEAHIDAARRMDHRQHHSGQHILSRALQEVAGAATTSVHMSADSMTIDVDRAGISAEQWSAVERLANQIVQEDRVVRCWFPDADELAALPVRKMPDVTGSVRIVDVGGFDITACGGTHVARTGEIGLIKVVKVERRGETTRLEFRCGGRAVADYSAKHEIVQRLVSDLTIAYSELPEQVRRMQTEIKMLRGELKQARQTLAEVEAQALLNAAEARGAARLIVRAYADRSADEARLLIQMLTAQSGVIALLGVAGEKAQLLFSRSDDVALDVVPLLKAALARLGSDRGGGRPNFAQGGGVPATVEQVAAALQAADELV